MKIYFYFQRKKFIHYSERVVASAGPGVLLRENRAGVMYPRIAHVKEYKKSGIESNGIDSPVRTYQDIGIKN
jgi:hypothetical protein